MRTSPRTAAPKAPLSRDAVLEAGLRVLRASGIDGVTMRAVAAELETGAASLYVYVRNRQELLDGMFDRVVGEVRLEDPPDPIRWREQLEAGLLEAKATMDRYPGIARVPLANVPTGPNALATSDRIVGILQAGGVEDAKIAWFLDIVFLFVNAASYENSIVLETERPEAQAMAEVEQAFGALDPDTFPHLARLGPRLASGTRDERFRWGLRLMIDGLVHTPPPGPG